MFTNRNISGSNEGTNQTYSKRKLLCRAATVISLLCSCLAISQHAGKSFCPTCIFQGKIFDTKYDCVQGLLLAAIILGIIAVLLSNFEQGKRTDESSHEDPSSDAQASSDKIQGIETKPIAPTNEKLKQTSQLDNELKASKVSFNAITHAGVRGTSKTVPSETLSCLKSDGPLPTKKECIPISSGPVVLYDKRQAAETQKQKRITFQSANTELSDHILQGLSRTWGWKPNNAVTSDGIVEITSSRKLTYFPEGSIRGQEKLKITTLHRGLDAEDTPAEQLKANFRERSKEEIQKRFNSFPSSLFGPRKDRVSEVATKMEALKFFHC